MSQPLQPTAGAHAGESLWQAGWRRLRANRSARVAGAVLIVLHLLAIFADFVGPYSETWQDRRKFYHPPTRVRIVDAEGRLRWPFVYGTELEDRRLRTWRERTDQIYPVRLFVRGEPYRLLWLIPTDIHLFGVDAPGSIFLLGTDELGRDIFTRLLFGARRSLFIGILGIVLTLTISLLYGGISGYFGGVVDNVMMRLAEIILAIPGFYLLVALSGLLPLNVPSQTRFFFIVVILSFVGWPAGARVVRSQVLSIKEQEFVVAARAMGANHLRIVTRHILPNVMSWAIVSMTLSVPGFILAESGLSLIGVGVQEPYASWGNMLSRATNIASIARFPWTLVPGLAIFAAVLAYNFLGDGIRDAFDPKAQSAARRPAAWSRHLADRIRGLLGLSRRAAGGRAATVASGLSAPRR